MLLPRTFKALTFHDALPRFREGTDSPRSYLERCIETIKQREPIVKAFEDNASLTDVAHGAFAARLKRRGIRQPYR
jgi:hypothetical protein